MFGEFTERQKISLGIYKTEENKKDELCWILMIPPIVVVDPFVNVILSSDLE